MAGQYWLMMYLQVVLWINSYFLCLYELNYELNTVYHQFCNLNMMKTNLYQMYLTVFKPFQIDFQEALPFFPHTNSTLQILEIKSKALHHSKTPELSLYHAGSYLQVRSLQSTVHVLFPRVWQLSLLWTGHVVHTSRSNTGQGVEEVRTD